MTRKMVARWSKKPKAYTSRIRQLQTFRRNWRDELARQERPEPDWADCRVIRYDADGQKVESTTGGTE